jgi:hypothetical protein
MGTLATNRDAVTMSVDHAGSSYLERTARLLDEQFDESDSCFDRKYSFR